MRRTLSTTFSVATLSLATFIALHGTASAAIPQSEKDALIAIYNATKGDQWKTKTNWKTASDPCSAVAPWFGVVCNATGTNVTKLNLQRNNLDGSIPADIANLPELDDIRFTGNKLTGSIPKEIGSLGKLANLYLDQNHLSGSIPTEIGNLGALAILGLGANELTGSIPASIGNLVNATDIFFTINKLSGPIPAEIKTLSKLKHLYIDYNSFTGDLPNMDQQLAQCTAVKGKNDPKTCSAFGFNALTISDPIWAGEIDKYNGYAVSTKTTFASTQTTTPKNFGKTAVGNTTIDLSWDAIEYQDGAGKYVISYQAAGAQAEVVETADKTVNSLQLTGLIPGTEYSIRIHSVSNTPGPILGPKPEDDFTSYTRDTVSLPSAPINVKTTGSKPGTGAGPADSTKSSFTVSNATPTATGTVTLTVIAKDNKGTRLTKGGDTAAFTITPNDSDAATITSVVDHGNGSYTAKVTGKKDVDVTVTATLNGKTVGSQAIRFGKGTPEKAISSGGGSGSTGLGLILLLAATSRLRAFRK